MSSLAALTKSFDFTHDLSKKINLINLISHMNNRSEGMRVCMGKMGVAITLSCLHINYFLYNLNPILNYDRRSLKCCKTKEIA